MHRRRMLKAALLTSLAAGSSWTGARTARAAGSNRAGRADDPKELAHAVTKGVDYFIRRCDEQLPLVRRLHKAVESGDLHAAKRAYVDARPPYEEIETLAADFSQSDRDIDARPYAFEDGEHDENFRGFHKIEALLYGYEDLNAARPYAAQLVESVELLGKELRQRGRFDAAGQFDGMVTLATEVSAKKISSEEETWSDQSLLIFRHNWIGIMSQYRPFMDVLGETDTNVESTRTAHEHAKGLLKPHFREGEAGGTPYSRIRIKERRAMADASNRLRDALISTRRAIGV